MCHRDEPGGTLHGLSRLRQFTQDDGHIFCSDEQAEAEIEHFCRSVPAFYAAFGFERVAVALSTRPADRVGDEAQWDRAEATLAKVCEKLGIDVRLQPGAGAFYGPKLEYILEDRRAREWQCGTIQFDLAMPERFDLRYVDSSGNRRHVVMLHRALYGSLERFLAMLLEQHGARLPAWLAPIQVVVLPVEAEQRDAASAFRESLCRALLRSELYAREESLSRRVAEARADEAPFIVVIGRREVHDASVTIRSGNEHSTLGKEEAIAELVQRCARPAFGP
jgi:threonyl-tRNA synthetase